ncbi:unnamed protein product [Closterium sp. NIES-65]|nr:unnamed protein product [Closterium sp. NIES-65]
MSLDQFSTCSSIPPYHMSPAPSFTSDQPVADLAGTGLVTSRLGITSKALFSSPGEKPSGGQSAGLAEREAGGSRFGGAGATYPAAPTVQTLVVVRHAEPIDEQDDGWAAGSDRPWDPPLSARGAKAAEEVGQALRARGFGAARGGGGKAVDEGKAPAEGQQEGEGENEREGKKEGAVMRVVVSPFRRCVQTAVHLVAGLLSSRTGVGAEGEKGEAGSAGEGAVASEGLQRAEGQAQLEASLSGVTVTVRRLTISLLHSFPRPRTPPLPPSAPPLHPPSPHLSLSLLCPPFPLVPFSVIPSLSPRIPLYPVSRCSSSFSSLSPSSPTLTTPRPPSQLPYSCRALTRVSAFSSLGPYSCLSPFLLPPTPPPLFPRFRPQVSFTPALAEVMNTRALRRCTEERPPAASIPHSSVAEHAGLAAAVEAAAAEARSKGWVLGEGDLKALFPPGTTFLPLPAFSSAGGATAAPGEGRAGRSVHSEGIPESIGALKELSRLHLLNISCALPNVGEEWRKLEEVHLEEVSADHLLPISLVSLALLTIHRYRFLRALPDDIDTSSALRELEIRARDVEQVQAAKLLQRADALRNALQMRVLAHTAFPIFPESLESARERFMQAFDDVAALFPSDNILCVTHGDAVAASVERLAPVTVVAVDFCGYSWSQRRAAPLYTHPSRLHHDSHHSHHHASLPPLPPPPPPPPTPANEPESLDGEEAGVGGSRQTVSASFAAAVVAAGSETEAAAVAAAAVAAVAGLQISRRGGLGGVVEEGEEEVEGEEGGDGSDGRSGGKQGALSDSVVIVGGSTASDISTHESEDDDKDTVNSSIDVGPSLSEVAEGDEEGEERGGGGGGRGGGE